MYFHQMLIAVLVFATPALSDPLTLEKNVYFGPIECEMDEMVMNLNEVTMEYTGFIHEASETGEKGKQFDTSKGREEGPMKLQIGIGDVIKGWDEGLLGLCKGAKATIVIPPEFGYGDEGSFEYKIPGGATLLYDVEILDIGEIEKYYEVNMFNELDLNGDRSIDNDELIEYFKGQGLDSVPDGLWESEDLDKNGLISWDEFTGPKGGSEEEL